MREGSPHHYYRLPHAELVDALAIDMLDFPNPVPKLPKRPGRIAPPAAPPEDPRALARQKRAAAALLSDPRVKVDPKALDFWSTP